ncbi:MAG: Ig-like domain-containing protein [Leptospiraceae bacterium]|nr:Ig-like domain-containing protein [Leptospiraceae bacterium]
MRTVSTARGCYHRISQQQNLPEENTTAGAARNSILWICIACASLLQCEKAMDLPSVLLGDGPSNSPSITISSPMPEQNAVRLDLPIFVEFDRRMNRRSVEDSFSFTGTAPTEGDFRWVKNRIYFELEQNLRPGASYELTVQKSATDENGVGLKLPYYLSFFAGSRIDAPQIRSMTPSPNAQRAAADSSIEITFSRPMSRPGVKEALRLAPAMEGTTTWKDGDRTLVYLPYRPLEPGKTYSVSISREAKDKEGISLANRFSASFQVGSDFQPPSVLNAFESGNPSPILQGQNGISKDSDFILRFDETMNYGRTSDACSLQERSPRRSINCVRRWNSDFTSLRFEPSAPLEPDKEYILECSKQSTDRAGNRLQEEFIRTFRIHNSAGLRNSDYLTLEHIRKVFPGQQESLGMDRAEITALPLPAPAPANGWRATLEIEFDHQLEVASLLPEHLTIASVAGPFPNSVYLKSIHFKDSNGLSGNVISLEIAGLHPNLYRLRFHGGRSGIKSARVPGETGTWMPQTRTIYFRPEAD